MKSERLMQIIEPPKVLKDWMSWETTSQNKQRLMRILFAMLEIVSLDAMMVMLSKDFNEAQAKALKPIYLYGLDAETNVHKLIDPPAVNPSELIENENTAKRYTVSNAEELAVAFEDIKQDNHEDKSKDKYEINIVGEIHIDKQIDISAQGKQETDVNTYFATNAGLVLPEGVNIKISGSDPRKDKLIFSNQKIGIYGHDLGIISISNLSIERQAEVDQEVDDSELVRSFIYLTTKNNQFNSSGAEVKNVRVINEIHIPKNEKHFSMMSSGMTFVGFSTVHVESAHLEDFYWDGIVAFGGWNLSVTDSTIIRNQKNYFHNEGAAVALIPGYVNAELLVNNTQANEYSKYFAIYGMLANQSSIYLTDVTTDNTIESGLYLTTKADKVNLERVNTQGKGVNQLILGGVEPTSNTSIIDSTLIINRDPDVSNFYEPENVKDILQSPNAKVSGTKFELNSITDEERKLLNKLGILFFNSR